MVAYVDEAIHSSSMEYKERLPDQCPPPEAEDCAYDTLWRAVDSDPPTSEDFKSHAEKGIKKPSTLDECKFRSCSMFVDKNKLLSLIKLPNLKGKLIAELKINKGAGRSLKNQKGHVDLWMYKSFDPISVIKDVVNPNA